MTAELLWFCVCWESLCLAVCFDYITVGSSAFQRHFRVIRDQHTEVTVHTMKCNPNLRHGSIALGYSAKHAEYTVCLSTFLNDEQIMSTVKKQLFVDI